MITERDRMAAEAFVRGDPLPPALEYSLLVEEIRTATNERRLEIWDRIEKLKNRNHGKIPT